MLAFPSMLVPAAKKAGIPTPEFEQESEEYNPMEFQKFHLFCCAQLGRSMSNLGQHWTNAEVIAQVPDDQIQTITLGELIEMGLEL